MEPVSAAEAQEGEVVVRHCTVRVVRHGGWSWGPAPERLPQRVVDLLPELLAQRFAAELAGEVDVEITESVTLVVPMSLARLTCATAPAAAAAPLAGKPPEPVPVPVLSGAAGPARRLPPGPSRPGVALAGGPELAEVLRVLLDRGRLDLLRELLSPAARAMYRAALAEPGSEPDSPGAESRQNRPTEPAGTPERPVDESAAPAGPTGPAGRPQPRGHGEVEVRSALPFLLAAALARVGVLDAIGPVLAGAGLAGDGPLFAAALAYKALGPVERGWLRSPVDRADAAASAGLDRDVPDDALAAFARRAGPVLPMLDGLLGLALCRGHEPGAALLLTEAHERYGGGLLLVEPEGLFPVAWPEGTGGVLPYWRACGCPPVVLSAGSSSAGSSSAGSSSAPALVPVAARHADELAEAGVPLVSGTAPARGERPWRRVPGPGRWWVTGPAPAAGYGSAGRVDVSGLTGGLDELVTAMAQRPAVPRSGGGTAFERTVTLTATLALGTVAWLLWRDREPPDPQLALHRLGDLGGLVRFEPESVRVRLPLGARHADLQRHGLLADVPRVAWLGHRTLTFSGG